MGDRPCPAYAIDQKTGERVYCEQGPAGHPPTHCGDRSQEEYDLLLAQAKAEEER